MATIKDVAREAGVSLMTVSRVINEPHLVKQDTLDKVNAAIKKLGYRPNLIAKSLVKGKSKTIGIILSNMYNQAYIDIITSIEKNAYKEGFVVINADVSNSKDAKQAFNMLLGSKVDGIIILPLEMEMTEIPDYKLAVEETRKFYDYFNEIRVSEDIKAITISQKMYGVPNIDFDYMLQARMTMDYLIGKGYKEISFLNSTFKDGLWKTKEEEYVKSMESNGLKENIDIEYTQISINGGRDGMNEILKRKVPRAVYCANDTIACGAIQAVLSKGYRIPEDIAIIGNDDTSACEYVYPKLTSIGLGSKEAGRYAIESLFKLFDKKEVEDSKTTPYLVERLTA